MTKLAPFLILNGKVPKLMETIGLHTGVLVDKADLEKFKEKVKRIAELTARSRIASSTAVMIVKLYTVLSQTSDAEVAFINTACAWYEVIYGPNVPPPPQVEPTKHLVDSGSAPYVDFAVWGPHGHRIDKKIALDDMRINADGTTRQVERYGPPDFRDLVPLLRCVGYGTCHARRGVSRSAGRVP